MLGNGLGYRQLAELGTRSCRLVILWFGVLIYSFSWNTAYWPR